MSRRRRFLDDSAPENIVAVILFRVESVLLASVHHLHALLILWKGSGSGRSHHFTREARARRGKEIDRTGRSMIRDFFTESHSNIGSEDGIGRGAIKPEFSSLRSLLNGGTSKTMRDRRGRAAGRFAS